MKKLSSVFLGLFIAVGVGCGDDPEIAKAEQLISKFNCSVTSVPEDADITVRYNFNAMQDDKDKVNTWLAHYKNGLNEFNSPISEVIQSQLKVYSSSCESLGGHLVN
ncbi:hypothetical protein [Acinetobacter johnsonii]|uniref:hypothetical protein n=1 Tax=Acinetobacter johnsonii TaxID=40214 RepID=UPI0024933C51|nr:hypothetical protein [Acinetobacter johnsonii]